MPQVGHLGVAAGQRPETVRALDRGDDRRGVVGLVVHAGAVELAADDQGRYPGTRAEQVRRAGRGVASLPGRRYVVPRAAELVVRDHDQGVLAGGSAERGLEQVDEVALAVVGAGVSRVFVLLTDGLDE